jgi:putative holliday junction resolvase
MAPRVLAIDLGQKRIGLAVSDALGLLAHGLPTVERRNLRVDIGVLHAVAEEHQVAVFLMGLPRHMDGQEGAQAAWARDFAARLQKRSKRPVLFLDERLSSVAAEEHLRHQGDASAAPQSRIRHKGRVDQLAAVILLQEFLDAGMPGLPNLPERSTDANVS